MKINLEKHFENIVFGIGKYTAIPALITAIAKTPVYGKEVLFAILLVLNWIILTEFKIRDIKTKVDSFKIRRKKK